MKSKEKPFFPLDLARRLADELVDAFRPTCRRIEIAGSVRRGVAKVHDLDLVAYPIYADQEAIDLFGQRSVMYGRPEKLLAAIRAFDPLLTEYPVAARILHLRGGWIPVEIYLAEHDGANFEALWQMRTGSETLNTSLAQRARALGLVYKAGYGIFSGEERVDDGTERGIFQALGVPYLAPGERSNVYAQTTEVSHE